jgi:hypothetical protein
MRQGAKADPVDVACSITVLAPVSDVQGISHCTSSMCLNIHSELNSARSNGHTPSEILDDPHVLVPRVGEAMGQTYKEKNDSGRQKCHQLRLQSVHALCRLAQCRKRRDSEGISRSVESFM